jgi:hypothetical protein
MNHGKRKYIHIVFWPGAVVQRRLGKTRIPGLYASASLHNFDYSTLAGGYYKNPPKEDVPFPFNGPRELEYQAVGVHLFFHCRSGDGKAKKKAT